MKGTNTIILNEEQMNAVMTEWWSGIAYSHKTKDKCIEVSADGTGNFEIILDEVKEGEDV